MCFYREPSKATPGNVYALSRTNLYLNDVEHLSYRKGSVMYMHSVSKGGDKLFKSSYSLEAPNHALPRL